MHKQNEKTTYRMGENICKWCYQQGINLQNYKQLIQLYIKKKIKKRTENLNRNFSKEGIQMAKMHMKRRSTLLIIRELEIKTIMMYHFTPVRMVIIKKSTNNKFLKGCKEKEILLHCV